MLKGSRLFSGAQDSFMKYTIQLFFYMSSIANDFLCEHFRLHILSKSRTSIAANSINKVWLTFLRKSTTIYICMYLSRVQPRKEVAFLGNPINAHKVDPLCPTNTMTPFVRCHSADLRKLLFRAKQFVSSFLFKMSNIRIELFLFKID